MEGKVLGNRYELIEKIGGGGMALVYKAKCRLLNRFVAVKILRPEFTNDEEFVKRFRVEAQAAASLSHPNIVSIYDVGQENSIHYLVMEYIDGITLKDYISQNRSLQWREAVNIAIQICSAIEQAHKKHIVHRDIKPHNIMLTKDGIAKVTDFGIARAVSSSTITMVGSTIGSVHYFSPEQARGGFVDEKSDLYSLGIALYEMVTGKVPFDGETPVAVALKHIQDDPEQPVNIDSDIPASVNNIIMKAIRKEQNTRYQNASELLSDLQRALKDPNGKFVNEVDPEEEPTRKIQAIGDDDIKRKSAANVKEGKKNEKHRDRFTVWLAVIVSVIIMGVFVYIGYRLVMPSILPSQNNFVTENYVGRNFYEVKQELETSKISVTEKRVFDDSVEKDIIMSQNVAPGQPVKPGGATFIELVVSDGPKLVKIPDFKKVDYRTVEAELKALGLLVRIEEEFTETVGNNLVIRTDPEDGEEVKPGATVTVVKSKGPELKQVIVPDLIGKTRGEVQILLDNTNLKIGKIYPEDVVSNIAKVIKQYPAAGNTVEEGTAVEIHFGIENVQSEPGSGDSSNVNNTSQGNNNNNNETPASQNGDTGRAIVTEKIALENPAQYGDKIKVLVEATPSDTNKVETIMNEMVDKSSFPITISIPVPKNGVTKVRILFDNKFYKQIYR